MTLLTPNRFIPELALDQIAEFAKLPIETGGFLFPEPTKFNSWIYALVNISSTPENSMRFDREEFIRVGGEYLSDTPYEWEHLTIWHTHPGGNIGPSRTDMKNRIPEMGNLVVTFNNGEVIPTWF